MVHSDLLTKPGVLIRTDIQHRIDGNVLQHTGMIGQTED